MSQTQNQETLNILKSRFEKNKSRHEGIEWADVQLRLEANPHKIKSLVQMEETGGEPDVVGYDKATNEFIIFDCSTESPVGRRNLCYDRDALNSRKSFKPKDSAIDVAKVMGVELLTEEQYRELQKLGDFDLKTSSWIKTPSEIRRLGGALFCDRRYDTVFVYHNGAESYYGVRGFRARLKI